MGTNINKCFPISVAQQEKVQSDAGESLDEVCASLTTDQPTTGSKTCITGKVHNLTYFPYTLTLADAGVVKYEYTFWIGYKMDSLGRYCLYAGVDVDDSKTVCTKASRCYPSEVTLDVLSTLVGDAVDAYRTWLNQGSTEEVIFKYVASAAVGVLLIVGVAYLVSGSSLSLSGGVLAYLTRKGITKGAGAVAAAATAG